MASRDRKVTTSFEILALMLPVAATFLGWKPLVDKVATMLSLKATTLTMVAFGDKKVTTSFETVGAILLVVASFIECATK